MLSQLPPDDPKTVQRQRACNPTLFQILLHSNFNMSAFLPHLTARTLSHLRQIMDDTVVEASMFLPSQAGASPVSLVAIFLSVVYFMSVYSKAMLDLLVILLVELLSVVLYVPFPLVHPPPHTLMGC